MVPKIFSQSAIQCTFLWKNKGRIWSKSLFVQYEIGEIPSTIYCESPYTSWIHICLHYWADRFLSTALVIILAHWMHYICDELCAAFNTEVPEHLATLVPFSVFGLLGLRKTAVLHCKYGQQWRIALLATSRQGYYGRANKSEATMLSFCTAPSSISVYNLAFKIQLTSSTRYCRRRNTVQYAQIRCWNTLYTAVPSTVSITWWIGCNEDFACPQKFSKNDTVHSLNKIDFKNNLLYLYRRHEQVLNEQYLQIFPNGPKLLGTWQDISY